MIERYRNIQDRIARACDSVGRDASSVTLIAVSKTYPASAIQELYDLGHRDFGESRLQELVPKVEELPKDIRWHFIGKLQSNKTRRAAEICHAIHTIETSSQLKELNKSEKSVDVFIEVNVAEEEQKSGILQNSLDTFVQDVIRCEQANLSGLMTIGPVVQDPEQSRPYFRKLRHLGESIGTKNLSMGMSLDFEVGIQEGATHIRVGTLLFGARD
ncbi:MAG: YggS family pyridoxal phosphate-dependent enzyme [Fimbriimonas sp.]|nr:YggS family pyridoxal phosphate-dependent enzyme [Fimbriimonas sp.]